MIRYRIEAECRTCNDIALEGEIAAEDEGSARMLAYMVTKGWAVGHQKHDQLVLVRESRVGGGLAREAVTAEDRALGYPR